MKRNLLAIVLAGLALQAGTASANVGFWTFDEPYWKQPVVASATQAASSSQAGNSGKSAYSFLTDYSN